MAIPDIEGIRRQHTQKRSLKKKRGLSDGVASALVIIVVIALWQILSAFSQGRFFVSPLETGVAFVRLVNDGYVGTPLSEHFFASLIRAALGYSIAVVLGIPIGLWMGMSRFANITFGSVFAVLRPIPTIAFIPLIILWLGIGEVSKVFLIAMTTLIFFVLSVSAGVASVPHGLRRAALNLGATKTQLFFGVILPGSLPSIMAGLRMGVAIAWSILVAAELIAAQEGLGYMILDASQFLRIDVVYVGIAIIGAVGLLADTSLRVLGQWIVHWEGK